MLIHYFPNILPIANSCGSSTYLYNGETGLAELLLHLLCPPHGLGLLLLQRGGPGHQVLGLALHLAHKEARHSELLLNLKMQRQPYRYLI